jgi:hypothetical protein
MRAEDHDRRYYDRDGQEDRIYRVYLGEQHREYRDFRRVKVVQQRKYFRWRHDHPDNVLFKVEVR